MGTQQNIQDTNTKRTSLGVKIVKALICIALVALCAALATPRIEAQIKAQAAHSIETSILNAATQCAAVEGAYPLSLEYLEQNYGLVINHDEYSITYEAFASNIAPSVKVEAK